jgi:chromosomal replication initiator protein
MSIEEKLTVSAGDAVAAAVGAAVARNLQPGPGKSGGLVPQGTPSRADDDSEEAKSNGKEKSEAAAVFDEAWRRSKTKMRSIFGEDVFTSWLESMEFERFENGVLHVSAPTKFLKTWIQGHYSDQLIALCRQEFKGAERLAVQLRQPGGLPGKQPQPGNGVQPVRDGRESDRRGDGRRPLGGAMPGERTSVTVGSLFEGSPLDARYTFENFVVGAANRLAHAAAKQVAETILDQPLRFNPLYIHSSVGLGKTHLLHAIAWDVKRRNANAQVLYLTAERFRYHFVGAVMAQDPMTFKDRFRGVDLLLIDDLEFMQGAKTEQEFDHTLNMLLDGGRQVVVASARAPSYLETLDARMRSRLGGGLVTEINGLDFELRLSILERRVAEKQAQDPSFEIGRDVLEFLAEKLTESGRELDGAVTRLYAACHYIGEPITVASAEHIIRDLMQGADSRRIKIDDILRVVSKHFGVSRGDILSQRRHRSVVWPRQIGMYLAKQLTSRSLPEIGRRFGGRDHTTVLHAIRKIDNELKGNAKLKDEIDDLKRMLNN